MNFFRKLFSGTNPDASSKRFIGIVASAAIIIIAFVDLFSNFTITEYVLDCVKWLALGGILGVASEKFADMLNGKKDTTPPPSE